MSFCICGYHGTDRTAARDIVTSQRFRPTRDEDAWLGEGVYFFWDSDDSHWWCTNYHGFRCYSILKADLKAETVFDLVHNRADQATFRKFCDAVRRKSSKRSDGKPRRNYMSLALKFIIREKNPDMIIGGFDQNRKFWFLRNDIDSIKMFPVIPLQVQLCVLKNDCIQNIVIHEEVS